MPTLHQNGAEAVPLNATPTTGNSGGGASENALGTVSIGAGGTLTATNAQAIHGTQSYVVTPASGTTDFLGWASLTGSATYAARCYMYFTALPTLGTFIQFRGASTQSGNMSFTTGGKPIVQDTTGSTIHNFTNAIPTNTWVRFEFSQKVAASNTGEFHVAFYTGDSGTATETYDVTNQNAGSANIVEVRFGKLSGTYTTAFYMDDLAVKDGSTTFIGATPTQAPSVPTSVTATTGILSATVNWTAPASNGGASITGYTVTASPGGAQATAGSSSTSAVVNGLVGGNAYTFTVHATNSVGDGPESLASNSVTVSAAGQVVSPIADITSSGWTSSDSASNLYTDIDETVRDDSQYITSPVNPSAAVYEAKFATVATPADNNGWQVQSAARYRSGSSGSMTVALVQTTTIIASQTFTLTSSFATYTLSLSSGQGATISNLADLRVRWTVTSA